MELVAPVHVSEKWTKWKETKSTAIFIPWSNDGNRLLKTRDTFLARTANPFEAVLGRASPPLNRSGASRNRCRCTALAMRQRLQPASPGSMRRKGMNIMSIHALSKANTAHDCAARTAHHRIELLLVSMGATESKPPMTGRDGPGEWVPAGSRSWRTSSCRARAIWRASFDLDR